MPTYQYRCENCHHEFEAFQTISEPPVENCPVCGGKVKRIISGGAGFIFKGSGFYITDYRSAAYKAAAEKERQKDTSPGSVSSASSSSERSKPASGAASNASTKAAAKK